MKNQILDVIVVGAGAAGLSAAQALGRSMRRTLVIDAGEPRNRFAAHMHNVLGHDGVDPASLLAHGREEAVGYGVEFRSASVRRVFDGVGNSQNSGELISLEIDGGETLTARALVVATGVTDVLADIPGLAEHWGTGVLHCPYCHGWEVRGSRVSVVTTSPMGMHQAKLLRQLTEHLTVFSAGLGDLDDQTLREFEARGVKLVPDQVTEIVGDGTDVTAVRTADGREYPTDAVYAMSTMVPRDDFLADLKLERGDTPVGSFITVDGMGRTSHPRVWAAGNVVSPSVAVPQSMGAGTFIGAAVNAVLVEEDFALAAAAFAVDASDVEDSEGAGDPERTGAADNIDGSVANRGVGQR